MFSPTNGFRFQNENDLQSLPFLVFDENGLVNRVFFFSRAYNVIFCPNDRTEEECQFIGKVSHIVYLEDLLELLCRCPDIFEEVSYD